MKSISIECIRFPGSGKTTFAQDLELQLKAGVRSDAHAGTTWGLKGTTPVVKTTGTRFGFNMISAVNAKGQCRFMIVERRVTAVVFCEFLRRLLQGMTRKIVLIVDGHPTHKAKRVQRFVDAKPAGWSCACWRPIHPT